uniref:SRCR domain-containing protein n=1 Tax=Paramormyrops kingsleyae TaxID=1676925 RepID=A0A3B3RRU1_9TELE
MYLILCNLYLTLQPFLCLFLSLCFISIWSRHDEVRLVKGGSPCAGTVEVNRGGQWGTIMQFGWDMNDATVVCRELGCGSAVATPGRAHFGEGSGMELISLVSCNGSEPKLSLCPSQEAAPISKFIRHPHILDAGVTCTGYSMVQLMGGPQKCSGRVEIKDGDTWAIVCDDNFDWQDAEVVCRELDCGAPSALHKGAHFGEGEGTIWSKDFHCEGQESFLHECVTAMRPEQNCTNHTVTLKCSEPADVRLVNGSSPCSGRVEVFRWGEWGTVYQRNWDMNDAAVVCRQLGCGSAVSVPGAAHFGEGSGRMVLGDVSCSGSESALRECGSLDGREHDLPHTLDAAVICSGLTSTFNGVLLKGKSFSLNYLIADHVSLVGGADRCSGWLEVKFSQSWATVCDGNFDWQDAEVVCRELDCGAPSALHKGAQSDQGEGPIWSKGFHCDGEELFLHECFTSQLGCVLTGPEDLRLVNGSSPCSGRVEVYRWGEWGTIAQYDWDLDDASVVCRQLGCGTAVLAPIRAHFGEGSGRCVTGFHCSGTESHLGKCRPPHVLNCRPSDQVSMVCSSEFHHNTTICSSSICDSYFGGMPEIRIGTLPNQIKSLRLVGEGSDCAGRLEVFHRGSWGTVCHESWGLPEAQVVCRQLRCGTALSGQIPVPTYFGPGTGPIWLSKLGCGGNESSLWDCPSVEWGRKDCGHKQDVGVVCSEHKVLRLSEGCSGHTEVYYNGSWGSVCFDGLEQPTVAVICHQLGCGDKGTVTYTMSRLHPDLNGLDFGKCRSHDTSLWQCPSSSKGPNGCSEAARTSCSDHPPLRLTEGADTCSGRVEVYHSGSWGTVCGDSWDVRDAMVVCRQLGCGPALRAEWAGRFGRGDGAIWLDEVNCKGSELHLWHCSYSLKQSDCSHRQDAGVTCAGEFKPSQSDPTVSSVVIGLLVSVLLLLQFRLLYRNWVLRRGRTAFEQGGVGN